jgi:hypothetical protein
MTDKKEEPMNLKVFVHVNGMCIAAREIEQKDGKIIVEHPAFTQLRSDKNGFAFTPFEFVVDKFNLYGNGLLGDTPMPPMMVPFYVNYIEERESKKNEVQ